MDAVGTLTGLDIIVSELEIEGFDKVSDDERSSSGGERAASEREML